jgi:o-succinylbenzoate---CoA ligase
MTMLCKNNTIIKTLRTRHIAPNYGHVVNEFIAEWTQESTHIRLQTSGSTGDKKIIEAPKQHLVESAKMTGRFFNFNQNTNVLVCLPLDFISGKMMLVRSLVFDMNTIITQPNNPLDYPEELSIDFAAMTPYQYEKALREYPEKTQKIKTILLGGAAISNQLKNKIISIKQQVFHSYGMTETYSHIALKKVTASDEPYVALPGITISQAEDRTLLISAPFLGIDKLKTNDVVSLLDERSFHYIGRTDFVVNSGGIKLHPEELEKKLSVLNWGFNFFFFGLPDETFGEKLVLFVETEQNIDQDTLNTIREKYELPKKIIYCASFVYTDSGKINRKLSAEKYKN